ncbi:MAG: flotillin family protein [Chloroflexi bacterium]|nr:flotillin family protein [Chloroflexota bacterium]
MQALLGPLAIAGSAVLVLILLLWVAASRYRKVGPNAALIVFGQGRPKVIKGGGVVVWPIINQARELSLELKSLDVAPQQEFYTTQGVAVNVEAVAQLKVKSDPESILTAAEQFLSRTAEMVEDQLRLVMEGHLRGIIGQLTVEEIVKQPEMVSDRVRENVADDMNKMGLEVISFTLKEVRDRNEYIATMGLPDIARIKREANIASAEAERDTEIRRAAAMREAAIARAEADQARVIAESASQTRQAEAMRDLALKRSEFEQSVKMQQAQTDKAYDIQANIEQQRVVAEQVRIDRVRKEQETLVQEAEIQRREHELVATVLKAAEIERQRIQTLAEAERQKRVLMATGDAEAARLEASGRAEAIRQTGAAEAEIIRAKGQAEAEAMDVKAQAFGQYNQAAILDKLLSSMPEVVRAMSEPLTKVDKITIVSTGDGSNGRGVGASQITNDITKMVAQAPAIFEGLTGVTLTDLLKNVPGLREGGGSHGAGDQGGTPPPAAS